MSIPRKHHFLPRVHLRKFKSDKGYNLFDKSKGCFYYPKSSAEIFRKKDLNTAIDENTGEVDYSTLEIELANKIDSNFNQHLKTVSDAIVKSSSINVSNIQECLLFFFQYAAIGNLRRMKLNKSYHENAFDFLDEMEGLKKFIINSNEVENNALKDLENFENAFRNYQSMTREVPYPIPISTDLGSFLPSHCECNIFIANHGNFILPDSTAIMYKSDKLIDYYGISYPAIKSIALPLTPNILIEVINVDTIENSQLVISALDLNRVVNVNAKLLESSYLQCIALNENDVPISTNS